MHFHPKPNKTCTFPPSDQNIKPPECYGKIMIVPPRVKGHNSDLEPVKANKNIPKLFILLLYQEGPFCSVKQSFG